MILMYVINSNINVIIIKYELNVPYINKFTISIMKIGNKLLNLLAKAFRNFSYYQC